jgi:hypothetical protein
VIAREEVAEKYAAFYRKIVYGISVILAGLTVALTLRLQSGRAQCGGLQGLSM